MVDFVVVRWLQDLVTFYGVIQHSPFRYPFRLETLVFTQILPIIISQMILGDDRRQSESGSNQEVSHHRFEACLAGLEVIASEERSQLCCVLHHAWVERVLWGAIQVHELLFYRSDCEEHGCR